MQTIARNFKKNPHTANFLMTFHAASAGLPSDIATGENDYQTPAEADLLNLVPERTATDARSPRQAELMESLIKQIGELDLDLGCQAASWTMRATTNGTYWTAGREGTASAWITKLIAKVSELKSAAKVTVTTSPEVADGRYAVEEDGTLKFFRVKNGRKAGFVFLDVQASDDWHPVRNLARITSILKLIAVDAHAAMVRYGHELGECGRCGKTLTDAASRAAGIGPTCAGKL